MATLQRWALGLVALTLVWNVIEGVVAVGSGAEAGSVALVGFGLDSFIEVAAAGVIIWRFVMPGLALGKRAIARRIGSRSLDAEAKETLVCSYLSLSLLAGLALNALFGWWWADPVAALAMVYFVVREGWEAVTEREICCDE